MLGALSKFDEFLLNPQLRTCSVAVPATSGNSNSENREPTGDRSLDDPYAEVGFSSHHSGNLNNPGVEDYPHRVDIKILDRQRDLAFFVELNEAFNKNSPNKTFRGVSENR